ncbi:extradiol dioxygenase [Caulobacter sp. 17J65-9]|uniref:VOC family protein n=1 Tax=Caulobacter sp. 17J65-9 TaxID=2709382 RepID=UPI0013C58099|nr:extradiol dioxygenase [Caulobacter sp. 17J65-9]NEX92944.1 extradiol dioxygenase [Caulobacter sp. 17J65-9]
MISGVHAMLYSRAAEQVRAFFRDVLEVSAIDAGGGWLIFKLPPAEMGVHPTEETPHAELYFMCDDLKAVMATLDAKGIVYSPAREADWGVAIGVEVAPGERIGIYQPRHPSPR